MRSKGRKENARQPADDDLALACILGGLDDLLDVSAACMEPRTRDFSLPEIPTQVVFGLSMKMGQGGPLEARQFGNVRSVGKRAVIERARRPLIDSFDDERAFTVLAEMPGVGRSDIEVRAQGDTLVVKTLPSAARQYYVELPLPRAVEAGASTLDLTDGILRVEFKKSSSSPSHPVA